ncbi:D-alanine--D-alanine ligase [Salinibacillus xinjiangensis]|uniref:D-alanine--D-alanine ligase n=1 Tax=Salinibacillus xinjiangensis TaxID=1229268 RepID=A0A6G1X5D6_9BACI|nr:D-alanine--D-alanine ligase [Salinibacillus xinjiangensis]MRG86139.1 D-alanine--D-alanine ligase [Salinibacillus xinjiangensis]
MSKKIKVGLIFGGKSAEHEVSLQSAKNIVEAINKEKYEVTLIGIDKQGKWHLNEQSNYLLHEEDPKLISLNKSNKHVGLVPGEEHHQIINLDGELDLDQLDVIFPILHGTLGEDGSIQGMLRLANLPYVGTNVLGSAVCMDKDIAKRLLRDVGIHVAKSITVRKHDQQNISFEKVKSTLGLPVFIKPANQGSSVGVSRVNTEEEFKKGLQEAFQFDHKLLIEENIVGREIECSVLGNEYPKASLPGEILPQGDHFYSYETKYIDESGAKLEIPANLSDKEVELIQSTSVQAFKALECEGLSRVDFFLKEDGTLVLNEINTLPGFTKISMYPKLWEVTGISYPDLIDQLIELAIDRHKRDANLKSSI